MTVTSDPAAGGALALPDEWQRRLGPALQAGERLVAWFAPDLDEKLHYAESLVVLTDRRLIWSSPTAAGGWTDCPSTPYVVLHLKDRAGVGSLELVDPSARLAHWRFTLARAVGAHRLVDRFIARQRGEVVEDEAIETTPCPSCGEAIPFGAVACPNCAPNRSVKTTATLWRLLQFARPRLKMILFGFGLTLASSAVALVPTYTTIPLMEKVLIPLTSDDPATAAIARQNFPQVKWYLLAFATASIAAWLLSWARTYVIAWVSERISADLRNQTYAHLQRLSLEYFGGRRTGDLMSRLSNDTERICNFLSINLLDFVTDVIMILMTVTLMITMDWKLALITLIPFPIIAWLVQVVRRRLLRSLQRGNRAWAEMVSVLADTIPGIRVVKAFAQERREVDRYRQSNDHVLAANDRVNRTWSYFGPLVNLLTQLGLLIMWAFGAYQVYRASDPRRAVALLTGFELYISRFYVRLESMSRIVSATQRAASSTQRLFEILDRTPSVAEPVRPVSADTIRGEIQLQNIGFRHGSRQILDGISLHIQPGEMIGLVGPSGAGKSTLVNLVCRFYDVAEGSILIDGIDVRSFPVSDYRRHIGIVLQEPFLFYGTIAENIAYGRPDASREEIISAARAARCHEFILRLPDGYDSLVGERGQSLSGGERQRISIARALLIDPRILILDEATSSVDTETEREIQEALDNLVRGRTTIAIAHRLSTLRKADRLVVLEKGRIAEMGQHGELIENQGAYARLHKAQAELALGIVN